MKGLSSGGKDRIHDFIEEMFENVAVRFLGGIKKLSGRRHILMHYTGKSLANLYVQAMQIGRKPNEVEKDALKGLLDSAYGFIEGLKGQTRASVVERVDGAIKEAHSKGEQVSEEHVKTILSEEMGKARSKMLGIAEGESTKTRNVGSAMGLSEQAANNGDQDPTVYFVIVRDGDTCKECLRLHMMPDGATPRVFKLSDLKHGYHKRGEDTPSLYGLHPHCRCTLTYLQPGWGFTDSGFITYKGKGHDQHKKQE